MLCTAHLSLEDIPAVSGPAVPHCLYVRFAMHIEQYNMPYCNTCYADSVHVAIVPALLFARDVFHALLLSCLSCRITTHMTSLCMTTLICVLQDHNVREELLVHIAKEATAVRDAGWRALKVVSDIDDTFLCSGGSFPSGQPGMTIIFMLYFEYIIF